MKEFYYVALVLWPPHLVCSINAGWWMGVIPM